MNPLQRLVEMRADVEELSAEVRAALSTITLAEARGIGRIAREVEGWLAGIRALVAVDLHLPAYVPDTPDPGQASP